MSYNVIQTGHSEYVIMNDNTGRIHSAWGSWGEATKVLRDLLWALRPKTYTDRRVRL